MCPNFVCFYLFISTSTPFPSSHLFQTISSQYKDYGLPFFCNILFVINWHHDFRKELASLTSPSIGLTPTYVIVNWRSKSTMQHQPATPSTIQYLRGAVWDRSCLMHMSAPSLNVSQMVFPLEATLMTTLSRENLILPTLKKLLHASPPSRTPY